MKNNKLTLEEKAFNSLQEERDLRSNELFGKPESLLQLGEIQKLDQYIYDLEHPEWKRVIYEGSATMYEVSNTGDIRNINTKLILKQKISRDGYKRFNMCLYDRIKITSIHRIVAITFIPNPNNLPVVNHLSGIKTCNWFGNLEWTTYKENTKHAIQTGLAGRYGEENPNNKFSEEIIHKACKILEEGKGAAEIYRTIGVTDHVIQGIKEGRLWKDLASQYNIPKPVNITRSQEMKDAMVELIFAGYKDREIVQYVGLPDTDHEREYVGLFRRRLFKKLENPNFKLSIPT